MEKRETITINGRKYQAKEIDFNFICKLELEGVEFTKMGKSYMTLAKVYAAYCMDVDSDIAGNEIQEHLINNGNINDIMEVISVKLDESDFFRAVSKNSEETPTETPKKGRTKKEAEA